MTDAQIFSKAECPVASRIINAFTKIESTDRRVTKLVMPPKAYKALRSELDFNLYIQDIPPDQMLTFARAFKREITLDGVSSGFDTKSDLWGARIVLGNRFMALSDEAQIAPMSVSIPYSAFMGGLTVIVKSRARTEFFGSPKEQRAQETLREMISESDFRKYLKYGFILVPGQSGKIYQIFAQGRTKVWDKGILLSEICIMFKDFGIPPTDRAIALKTLVESSEEEFYRMGNVYKMKEAA
jgi:hypothetical protein